jgi:hypothetical protein
LIIDILRYDWLRCGYRKLPECLECDGISESMAASRDIIYNWLPESMDGVYTAKTRNLFFKRSVFLRLSYAACRFLSIKGAVGDVRIALTQEREKTLHGHNCIFLLDNNVVAEN